MQEKNTEIAALAERLERVEAKLDPLLDASDSEPRDGTDELDNPH